MRIGDAEARSRKSPITITLDCPVIPVITIVCSTASGLGLCFHAPLSNRRRSACLPVTGTVYGQDPDSCPDSPGSPSTAQVNI
jgi:hypothetical protein